LDANLTILGVWYKLKVAISAKIVVSTCNQANFDMQIAIYTSGTCGSFVCKAVEDDAMGCAKYTMLVVTYV